MQKPTSFSESTNQNGGIQIYPIWKKESEKITPCKMQRMNHRENARIMMIITLVVNDLKNDPYTFAVTLFAYMIQWVRPMGNSETNGQHF